MKFRTIAFVGLLAVVGNTASAQGVYRHLDYATSMNVSTLDKARHLQMYGLNFAYIESHHITKKLALESGLQYQFVRSTSSSYLIGIRTHKSYFGHQVTTHQVGIPVGVWFKVKKYSGPSAHFILGYPIASRSVLRRYYHPFTEDEFSLDPVEEFDSEKVKTNGFSNAFRVGYDIGIELTRNGNALVFGLSYQRYLRNFGFTAYDTEFNYRIWSVNSEIAYIFGKSRR